MTMISRSSPLSRTYLLAKQVRKKTIRVFHEFEEVTSGMKTSGLAMRVNSVSYSKENCFPYDSDKVG